MASFEAKIDSNLESLYKKGAETLNGTYVYGSVVSCGVMTGTDSIVHHLYIDEVVEELIDKKKGE